MYIWIQYNSNPDYENDTFRIQNSRKFIDLQYHQWFM